MPVPFNKASLTQFQSPWLIALDEIGVVWEHKSGKGFHLDIVEGLAVSGRVVILPPKEEAEG